jgi:hypothetical protein
MTTRKETSQAQTKMIKEKLGEARKLAEAGELTDYRWDRSHKIHALIYDAEKIAKKQGRDITLQVDEIADLAYARAFMESIKNARRNAEEGNPEMVEKWHNAIVRYGEGIGRAFPKKTYQQITQRCYEVCAKRLEQILISQEIAKEGETRASISASMNVRRALQL